MCLEGGWGGSAPVWRQQLPLICGQRFSRNNPKTILDVIKLPVVESCSSRPVPESLLAAILDKAPVVYGGMLPTVSSVNNKSRSSSIFF